MTQANVMMPNGTDVTYAIDIQNLTHVYPPRRLNRKARKVQQVSTESITAINDLSLQIKPAEIFGILGPNGSGKSTLFHIISTLLSPTNGSVNILGHNIKSDANLVRQQLGVVFQSPSLDGKLTAMENIIHHGHLYGMSGSTLQQAATDALTAVSLLDRANDFVETFSGGMKRRIEIAKAVLHQPHILLMDEPSTGLDPAAKREIWEHVKRLRDTMGITVLMTTHLMDEAEKCDRLAIFHHGKLVANDTPDALKQTIGGDIIQITPQDDMQIDSIQSELKTMFADSPVNIVEGNILIETHDGPSKVAQIGHALGTQLKRISVGQPTLEDVFIHLTGDKLGGH